MTHSRSHSSSRLATRSHVAAAPAAALAAALAAVAALTLGATAAQAQPGRAVRSERQLVAEWEGRVDREVQIDLNGSRPVVRGVGGSESRGRFRSTSALPQGAERLTVEVVRGRGQVDVVQQPGIDDGRRGRYTVSRDGIVRIRDPQGGADTYRIRVYAQPTGVGGRYDRAAAADDANRRRDESRDADRSRAGDWRRG